MRVCGPRNTVETTGKVLECLDSIMAFRRTMPVCDVDLPRAVAASNLVSFMMAAKFARSLSVARRSRWASLGHTGSTSSTNSVPLILGEASATLLQSTNQKLNAALTFEIIRTSQLVEIIGELLGSLTEVERFESLLVVCFRGLDWRWCFFGWRRADTFPGFG